MKTRGSVIFSLVKRKMHPSECAVSKHKARITCDRLLEQIDALEPPVVFGRAVFRGECFQVKIVGDQVARGRPRDGGFFAHRDFGLELISDRLSDFTLDGKDICHIAIVGLRPEMGIGARVDELRVDP